MWLILFFIKPCGLCNQFSSIVVRWFDYLVLASFLYVFQCRHHDSCKSFRDARRLDYSSCFAAAPPPSSPLHSHRHFVTGDAPWVRGSGLQVPSEFGCLGFDRSSWLCLIWFAYHCLPLQIGLSMDRIRSGSNPKNPIR